MNEAIPCRCGNQMEFKIGSIKHKIVDNEITVTNIPHYYCSYCNLASYDSNTKVSWLLKRAYENGLKEICYEKY